MVSSKTSAVSWVNAFRNILDLEESHGFDNSAVVGGLDRFIQRWTQEMADRFHDSEQFRQMGSTPYSQLSAEERGQWAAWWRELLNSGPEPAPTIPAPSKSTSPQPCAAKGKVKDSIGHMKTENQPLPPAGLGIESPVNRLRGVDVKLSKRLEKLEVETVRDLLYLFPRRHQDYSKVRKIAELTPGEECTVIATVWEAQEVAHGYQGRRRDTEAVLSDDSGNIRVIWFGQRYLARTLKPNSRISISGKVEVFQDRLVFQSPEYEMLEQGGANIHTGRLIPVYPLTEGLTGRNLRRITWQALEEWLGGVEELLPPELLSKTGLKPLRESVKQAHYPDDLESWEAARRRLSFDELITLKLAVQARRRNQR